MLQHLGSSSAAGDATAVNSTLIQTSQSKEKKKRSKVDHHDERERSERKNKRKHGDKESGHSEIGVGDGEHKKKKKRKDNVRELQPTTERQDEDGDSDIDANAQASTAALLNAIVAAVSSATPPEDPPTPQVFAPPPPQHLVPQSHFMPFSLPFNQFAPGAVGPSDGSFPTSVLNGLSFGTNDDVLRALHNMDMSKFGKGSGDPSMIANMSAFAPPPSMFAPPPPAAFHVPPPPVTQPPVGSSTALDIPKNTTARQVATPVASNVQSIDRHADLLATKWLNARKLAELVESEGLVFKKGKFSATEERQINEAIEEHKKVRPVILDPW